MQIFNKKKSFKKEFRRQLRMAIMAAIGFTIAYSWKESIFNAFQNYVSRFLDVPLGHYLTQTYTAVAITAIGVLLIFITSKILRD